MNRYYNSSSSTRNNNRNVKTRKRRKANHFTKAFLTVSITYVIIFVYFFIQHSNDVSQGGQNDGSNSAAYNELFSSYISAGSSSSTSISSTSLSSSSSEGFSFDFTFINPLTHFEQFLEYFQENPIRFDKKIGNDDYYSNKEGKEEEEDDAWDEDDDFDEENNGESTLLEDDQLLEEKSSEVATKKAKENKEQSFESSLISQSSFLTMYGQHKVQPSLNALPKWFREYTEWNHKVIPQNYEQSKFQSQYNTTKYLVLVCLPRDQKCGGLTDRLRALPFYLYAAKVSSRVLCIHWTRPFPLEYFLIPPRGGIEWRCPAELGRTIDYSRASHKQPNVPLLGWLLCKKDMSTKECAELGFDSLKNHTQSKFVITRIHKNSHNRINEMNSLAQRHSYKDEMPKLFHWLCPDMFGDIFRVMFEPIPILSQQINATMTKLGLVENQYVAAHARTHYPVPTIDGYMSKSITETDKEGGFEITGKLKKHVMDVMRNSIHCAHLLQPDLPMLFMSDDEVVTKQASLGFKFKQRGDNPQSYELHPKVIDREAEPKHFDISTRGYKKVEEFFGVFEDLLIMGGAKCVSHGVGSFGSLGAALSGNKCRAIHRTPRGRREFCPNERGKIETEKIDQKDMLFGEVVGGEGKIEYLQ